MGTLHNWDYFTARLCTKTHSMVLAALHVGFSFSGSANDWDIINY